jgi:hypothetical protein
MTHLQLHAAAHLEQKHACHHHHHTHPSNSTELIHTNKQRGFLPDAAQLLHNHLNSDGTCLPAIMIGQARKHATASAATEDDSANLAPRWRLYIDQRCQLKAHVQLQPIFHDAQ